MWWSTLLKIPPKVKVLEALGAIGDNRIKVVSDTKAEVTSSEGDKVYKVYFYSDKMAANSTDNGTRFRKYVGYPIIAFLMVKGVLSFNDEYANALKGIDWKKINDKFKDYSKTIEYVYNIASERGVNPTKLDSFADKVLKEIKDLKLKFPWES